MNLWSPVWPWQGLCWFLVARLLHCGNVLPLVLRHECVQRRSSLVLLFVELVNDHTDKKIESEEASKHNEGDKVDVEVEAVLKTRLVV